ncbi:uncharacterized protein LOC110465509 [Mizuhopecten yessoensis]|uniref:uncharacterized protein LOC110465509 n=1 Tax=Mizuhopecten yessoensis TaxID=6573 RepID=UPI000B45E1E5|nr:uncharacterized protein LOC110465509 [Mizuhopecten yessoensis]
MTSVDDVSDILSEIRDLLPTKFNISEKVEIAKEYFQKDDGSLNLTRLEEVYTILKDLYGYLPEFTSGDPSRLLQGLVGIVSSVSSFTGVGGQAVPVICGVFRKVFASFGGNKVTIGEVVEGEIRRVFSIHSDETLLEEGEDLHLMYRFAFDFLNPTSERSEFSKHDITNMNIQMNVFQGATFLRKLGKLTRELAKEHEESDPNKKSEKANKARQFIELYIKLALLSDMVLLNFFTITNSTSHSQHLAGGIQRVIGSFDEQDREALGMLLKPTKEYVYIASYINEEECELFMKFLEHKNLLLDQSWLQHGQFELCSVKWPKCHALRLRAHTSVFGNGDLRFLRGTKEAAGPESLFCFKQIHPNRSYFSITQMGNADEFVSMTKGSNRWVMSLKGVQNPENEWKIIQMENGNYVFSPRAFPDYFMGMTKLLDGSIAGFLGGYNEQVQWTLKVSE